MANSIALIGLLIASQNLSITTSAGLHRFFNLIRVGLAEIIPHNVCQCMLIGNHLPGLADPGIYENGKAAILVRMDFFLHGGIHVQKINADGFCQQWVIHIVLL